MRVLNVHRRRVAASREQLGALLNRLSSPDDPVWPRESWPRVKLDGPLAIGAKGGHGPIRYAVEELQPNRLVAFRFLGPRGFHGGHRFEILDADGGAVLQHVIEMRVGGPALLTYPLVFRPLHDALMEECLDKVARAFDPASQPLSRRSAWVRLLRWVLQPRRRPTPAASARPG